MADDFDKEAPDVTENQFIGENLRDFSVVVIKTEVVNFYDSEFESTTSSVQDRKPFFQEEIIQNTFEALSSEKNDTENFQSNILDCNKIIVGSNPNVVHGDEDNFAKSPKPYQENDVFSANNTNHNSNSIDENFFEELVTSFEPKIELHDIQSYLHKSKRFCETCGILFPELNAFETHIQKFHTKTSLAVIPHLNSDLAERRIYKCRLCDKKFVASQVLRRHLSNIHRLKNGNKTQKNKHRYKRALDNTMRQHRCSICGLKFVAPHVLKRHLIDIHKLSYAKVPDQKNCQSIMNTVNDMNRLIVNSDNTSRWCNTCFHCKKPFDTQKSLIEHLYDVLQMKRKNTEIVPVLKSILFKCNKCDIHFTSSQFAANHAEHMEMLINWKCTICNRIFKNEDALSHERQHSVTNNFLVYNLEDLDVTKILYKCSKCAVHFTESNFLYHFRDCGLEYSKFMNCKICNVSLDYNLKPLHESDEHTEPNYYTIIESDVISDNPVKSTANKHQAREKLKELLKSFREVKVVLQKIDSSKLNKLNKLNTEKWSSNECVSDFKSISDEEISKKSSKLQKGNNVSENIRPTSLNTTRQSKDMDLRRRRNLTFYFCKTCKCFVTKHKKKVHLEARCKNISKEDCKHCGLMFTSSSLMTHRQLHKEKKDLSINDFKFFNLYNGLPINPANPEALNIKRTAKIFKRHGRRNLTYYYCETCKCFLTKFNNAKLHKCKLCKTISKTLCKYCGLTFTSASMMTHRRLHEERKDLILKDFKFFNLLNGQPMNPPVPELMGIDQSVSNEAQVENIECFKNIDNWHTRGNMTYYYCETCKCFITKFRKDAHLQGRCKKLAKMSCKHCGLMFTNASMVTHLRLHQEKADLSLKDFNFFNLYNGQPMNPPVPEATNNKRPVNKQQAEIVNINRPVDIEAKVECLLRPINNKAESENGNQPINIRAQGVGQPMNPELISTNESVNNEAQVENVKRSENIDDDHTMRNLIYYYCETCKCCLTKNKDVHLEARCLKLAISSCELCGLKFTNLSMMTHMRLHEKRKNLTLNNFTFLSLYNDQPMNPPVPELMSINQSNDVAEVENIDQSENIDDWQTNHHLIYYYCGTCKCCLTRRFDVHLGARCMKLAKLSCKHCGLTFTKLSMVKHMRLHEERTDFSLKNFKFFDLYNGQPRNPPISDVLNLDRPVNTESKVEHLNNDVEISNKRMPLEITDWRTKRNLTYYFCETCKCFVTKYRKEAHLEARCKNLSKGACKPCGLMFTTASLMTHRQLHKEKKDLSINHFKFFNLYNGQPINPAKPEALNIKRTIKISKQNGRRNLTYLYCETCKCFLTKFNKAKLHNRKLCKNLSKTSCKYCGLMFTSASMMTHRRLHEEREDLTLKDFKFFNLHNGQPMNPPVPELMGIDQSVSNEAQVENIECFKNIDNWHTRRNMTYYYCETCKCFITKFRKDAHLQGRCKKLAKMSCKHCGLMFTNASMVTHLRLHQEKADLSLKDFNFLNLYNGQPMNPPVPEATNNKGPVNKQQAEIVNINRPVDIEAKVECLLRPINNKAESENGNQPINIRAQGVNEDRPINIEGEAGNSTLPLPIVAEYEKLLLNNESEALHFERPINIEAEVGNKNRYENIEGQSVNVTPLLQISGENKKLFTDNESLQFEQPINLETEAGNEVHSDNIEGEAVNVKPLLHIESKNKNLFLNNEAKSLCLVRPINIEAEVVNGSRVENIEGGTVHVTPLLHIEAENKNLFLNNEAQSLCLVRPINIEAEVVNGSRVENIEGGTVHVTSSLHIEAEAIHLKKPINIEAEVGDIIQLVNNKSQAENVLQPLNIEADIGSIMGAVNNGDRVLNVQLPTNIEAETENLKLILNNETELNIKETVNAEAGVVNMNQPENVNKRTVNLESEVVYITQPSNNEPKVSHSKISGNTEDWRRKLSLSLYFCETCKCFVTKYTKTAHLQARCNIFAKMTCKRCGLTFTTASMVTHERLHEECKDLSLNNFKFFNLNGQPMNPPLPEVLLIKEPVSVEKELVNIKKPACKEAKANNAKVPRRNLTYYFCDTCKCFTTKFKKDAHLQARCKKFPKSNCKRCGLKFTKASMITHKRLHREKKDISLNNLKFFNLYNGQRMKAPTAKTENRKRLVEERNLTNYYCRTCKCFVSPREKTAHVQANCINMFKIPCKHCGLILSGTSFPLHKSLHEERKDLTLNNLKFLDLNSGQPMNPPIPDYPKCANCAVHFLTITAKNSHICNEVSSLTCHICEIPLSEAAFKLHMTFHQHATDNTNTIESNILESATNLDRNVENHVTENDVTNTSNLKSNEIDLHNSLDVAEAPLQKSSDMYSIVYCCRNCSVSVDTYDKAVEHSQTHYETYEHETQTILCNSCNLKIDEACFMEHQTLHESETRFELLHFDSYYLPAENNLWIKHIFKTLPNEEVLDILRNSIYRFECRIKMDVIQKGDPNFTVYKCDRCNCFIEPTSLFKHSENACFKLRNHPCTICGIAFNSAASRIDHEKIHNQSGLTTESYRIVVFNRERDLQVNRSFCLRKKYVLYKCRNCDVIIENPREDIHKCDFTDVKNCPHCALLLNMKDYESHLNMHKNFISFNYSNMKVVLLGESIFLETRSENNSRSKFKGAIYDYKMFVCNKCEICIRNEDFMPKHICRFGKQRLKCSKCDLYFSVGRLKNHMKRHEQDPDFVRSNMYIISFDPCALDQNKNATKLFTKDKNCEQSDSNTDSDLEYLSPNGTETEDVTSETVEEETTRIYKCSCELHFLNEDSLFRHFGTCRSNPKITKIKCHKCDLVFTPNVLFTHMLAHHNNKGRRYKYDIIKVRYN